jgi:hypothetical protein
MIPLKKDDESRKEYAKWFKENKEELKEDFDDYYYGKKKDWIKHHHR